MDFEDKLIREVRRHPLLYLNKDKTTCTLFQRNKLWSKIARKLNRPQLDCKLKWRNIRDSYKRHKNKKNSGVCVFTSKYDTDKLSFLDKDVDISEGLVGDEVTETAEVDQQPDDEIDTKVDSNFEFEEQTAEDLFEEKQNPLEVCSSNTSFFPVEVNHDIKTETLSEENDVAPLKKARKQRKSVIAEEVVYEKDNRLDRNKSSSSTHAFFKCMADIVSTFPPEKIADIRMKICSVITETEMMILRANKQNNYFR